MSAIPEEFIKRTAKLSEDVTRPMPGSKKIYVQGSREDIRVAMREVALADTPASFGAEKNPPVTLYDTAGPYTDPQVEIDLMQGLPPLRSVWIEERGDSARLQGPSSEYGQRRQVDPAPSHLRFEHLRSPLRAKAERNVTQMHYARQGIITPEMEYVAIRENLRREQVTDELLRRQHKGVSVSALRFRRK